MASLDEKTAEIHCWVYQFDPEWNGQVIIEERTDQQQRFLGHHFPASDLPAQARRLYRINRTRQISNAHYTPVPLVPAENPHTGTLDLSRTQLRSISPTHLEYMRNMGTLSSLTLSLMVDGHLWGLLVSHGDQPRYLCPQTRTFCSMVVQLVSENLQLAFNRQFSHQMSRLGRAIDQFNAGFQAEFELSDALSGITHLLHDEEMAHLATHDKLTGLPNRLLLEDRLERSVAKARRDRGVCAMLFMDLDGFKPINDQHGHDTGNEILRWIKK